MPNAYIIGAAVGLAIMVGTGLFMWLTNPEPMRQRRRSSTPRPGNQSKSRNYENENCLICTDKKACVKVYPCQHTPMCVECTEMYRKYDHRCPLCREKIEFIQMPWE